MQLLLPQLCPAALYRGLRLATCRAWGWEGARAGDPQERGCHRGVRQRSGLAETSLAGCHCSPPQGGIPEPWHAGKMPAGAVQATGETPLAKATSASQEGKLRHEEMLREASCPLVPRLPWDILPGATPVA